MKILMNDIKFDVLATHANIASRVGQVCEIIKQIGDVDNSKASAVNDLKEDIIDLFEDYLLSITVELNNIYMATNLRENEYSFYVTVSSNNFIGRLEMLVNELTTRLCAICANSEDLFPIISQLEELNDEKIVMPTKITEAGRCPECCAMMYLNVENSEYDCKDCLISKPITATILKANQIRQTSLSQKFKSSTDEIARHYDFRIERLQALETRDFTDSERQSIKSYIEEHECSKEEINCRLMRKIIKVKNMTHLNDHIPLLVKTFGNKSPPILTYEENKRVKSKFIKAAQIYSGKVEVGKNTPYYQYLIYKICEHEFQSNYSSIKLLNFIHLQGTRTLRRHDEAWQKICEQADRMDDLHYSVTNRNKVY